MLLVEAEVAQKVHLTTDGSRSSELDRKRRRDLLIILHANVNHVEGQKVITGAVYLETNLHARMRMYPYV